MLCLLPLAHSAPLVHDAFDYPDGALVNVSSGVWNTHSGTTGQLQVVSGRALLANTNSEDVNTVLGQSFPTTSGAWLYASFTLNLAHIPSAGGDFFAHFKGSGTTSGFHDKVFVTTNGVPYGFYRLGLANEATSAPSVVLASNLTINTDYTVVTRLVVSNGIGTLWINPSAETDPSVTATDTATASAESTFALRESSGIGILYVDNLFIGTNFNDILPSVPPAILVPPQSLTVVEGSNVTFTVTASGTPPLSYQWQRNSTNLADATASALSLPAVTTNQSGSYSVTVTNAFGSTNSAAATLTVNPLILPPSLIASPTNQTVIAGGDVAFMVTASGTPPLAYQWQFNGTNLAGATGTQLLLASVTPAQAGSYLVVVTNAAGATSSPPATLTVTVWPPATAALSILTYNVLGSGATNWSTNSLQVQAIGRQVQFLNPDVITFQEIPMSLAYEMTNFVQAFLPGYYLSNSPTADGFTRSSIASRYPIARATSWLRQADLAPYGYTNSNFSRDLYEAQLTVPGFDLPLHVFTAHLKSGSSSDERAKRNAEACAVSNFLVTAFLPTNASHPYILTGDLNETDISQPSIQTLISAPTGLQLTTPLNPFTGSPLTYSIQSTNDLTKRFDYFMPGPLLASNVTGSQIFRTDRLTNPPPPLLADDDSTASDHLPVMMYFNNPFSPPFRVLGITLADRTVTLSWESSSNRLYHVHASSNLTSWAVLASNVAAAGAVCTFQTNVAEGLQFYRVYRVP
jgi:endonuclease/exonuclease/phosphatase family metal-dependent hydrolase